MTYSSGDVNKAVSGNFNIICFLFCGNLVILLCNQHWLTRMGAV